MATVEAALVQFFLSKPEISDLVGGERIQPHNLEQENTGPDSEFPVVTYEIISSAPDDHLLSDRSGLVSERFQWAAWAYTYAEAAKLARAMKRSGVTALYGMVNGIFFNAIQIASGLTTHHEMIGDGQQQGGSQQFRYIAEFDLQVTYQDP